MQFDVYTAEGNCLNFQDATYQLREGGALEVTQPDRVEVFSPTGWRSIVHTPDEPTPPLSFGM